MRAKVVVAGGTPGGVEAWHVAVLAARVLIEGELAGYDVGEYHM